MSDKKTNVGQCPNGHFYNMSKYDSCPICAKEMKNSNSAKATETAKTKEKSIIKNLGFGKGNKDDNTVGLDGTSKKSKEKKSNSSGSTLQRKIDEAKAPTEVLSDDSKTVAYYNLGKSEPVVGWLVCIKGEYYGESFNLVVGRNNIGRGSGMDIALVREMSVSRNKHAIITYEPKHSKFYIQAGESRGLTYLNGQLVVAHEELHDYDVITLADAVFVFVPLCGDRFNWNDTEKYYSQD